VTFNNGKDTETLGDIEMAGPGFFPPGYNGIQAVLLTECSGNQPASITFNSGEKKGVGLVGDQGWKEAAALNSGGHEEPGSSCPRDAR